MAYAKPLEIYNALNNLCAKLLRDRNQPNADVFRALVMGSGNNKKVLCSVPQAIANEINRIKALIDPNQADNKLLISKLEALTKQILTFKDELNRVTLQPFAQEVINCRELVTLDANDVLMQNFLPSPKKAPVNKRLTAIKKRERDLGSSTDLLTNNSAVTTPKSGTIKQRI